MGVDRTSARASRQPSMIEAWLQLVGVDDGARRRRTPTAPRGWRRTRWGTRPRASVPFQSASASSSSWCTGREPVTSRDAPDPGAPAVEGLVGGRHHRRVGGQPEVVVGGEGDHRSRGPVRSPVSGPVVAPGVEGPRGPPPTGRRPPGRRRRRPMPPTPTARRRLTRRPRPDTSPMHSASTSTTRSSSSAVMVSGGMTTTTSPSGRSSTPRRTAPGTDPPAPAHGPVGRGQLDPDHETPPADLGHAVEAHDRSGRVGRPGARPPRSTWAEHVPLVEQLQVPQGHRAGQGVPAVGVAVVEGRRTEVLAEERRRTPGARPPWPTAAGSRR